MSQRRRSSSVISKKASDRLGFRDPLPAQPRMVILNLDDSGIPDEIQAAYIGTCRTNDCNRRGLNRVRYFMPGCDGNLDENWDNSVCHECLVALQSQFKVKRASWLQKKIQ